MQFRAAGHRDERRRRVLMEESRCRSGDEPLGAPAARSADAAPPRPRRYADVALTSHQPRIGDLIPCRLWTLTVWTAFLFACVAGMETLYGYVALGYLRMGDTRFAVEQLPAIDLAGSANVACWFSAWLLSMAAVLGYLTYLIRRHRLDDYRGRYRMWYWVVALLIIASLDQVAHLQASARVVIFELAGFTQDPQALLMWSVGLTTVLALIGLRVAAEMRASRLALIALMMASTCYGLAVAAHLGSFSDMTGALRVMALSALVMTGHISLLGAFCLYARHVHRDACGQLPVRRRKRRRTVDESTRPAGRSATHSVQPNDSTRPKRRRRVDPPHEDESRDSQAKSGQRKSKSSADAPRASNSSQLSETSTVRRKRKRRRPAETDQAADSETSGVQPLDQDSPDDSTESRPLSKAERKRLRKLKRKQRQAATS